MKLYRLAAISAVFEDGICDYELLHNESFTEQEFKTQIQTCLEQVKPFAEQYVLSPAKGMHTEPIYRWDDDTIKSVCEKMVEIFGYEIPEYALIYNNKYYSQFSTVFDLPVNVSNTPMMTGEEFDRIFGFATYIGTTLPARVVDKGEQLQWNKRM